MSARLARTWILLLAWPWVTAAQETNKGFEMPLTLSGGGFLSSRSEAEPRSASAVTAGGRAMAYPTLRLNKNWYFSGALQFRSRPYFVEELTTQGYGAELDVIQGYLGYDRFWGNSNYVSFKAGQLSSAFGSFLLRYDDAVNPLIDMPLSYGYYYAPVTTLGLAGTQADLVLGRFDVRGQFTNSSPVNRRSLFDSDQYGGWTGGAGYTITQGVRVGASFYRGPYLHRDFAFFFPGESAPKSLPSTGYGLDVEFARGHWNLRGEWQKFSNAYDAIPTYRKAVGYSEAKYTFHPRWYVAARTNHARDSRRKAQDLYEVAVGYRPNRRQLLKVGYQQGRGERGDVPLTGVFAVQLVTQIRGLAAAWD